MAAFGFSPIQVSVLRVRPQDSRDFMVVIVTVQSGLFILRPDVKNHQATRTNPVTEDTAKNIKTLLSQ